MKRETELKAKEAVEAGFIEKKQLWQNTPLVLALVGTISVFANGLVAYVQAARTAADTVTLKELEAKLRESEKRSEADRERQLSQLKQQFNLETSDADAKRLANKEEREFSFKIIEQELAKTGDSASRAEVLLFLVRAGVLNSLNRTELERMALSQYERAGKRPSDVGIPPTLGRQAFRRPSGQPPTAQDEVNVRMYETASSFVGYSTADVPGTNQGRLAVAWCVNEIARVALGKPISGDGTGDNGLSTAEVFDVLKSHHIQRPIEHVDSGMVIISPTTGNVFGSIGVIGKRPSDDPGNFAIYSLNSASASFQQNFTMKSWQSLYQSKGLATYFFELNYKEF